MSGDDNITIMVDKVPRYLYQTKVHVRYSMSIISYRFIPSCVPRFEFVVNSLFPSAEFEFGNGLSRTIKKTKYCIRINYLRKVGTTNDQFIKVNQVAIL